MVNFHQACKAVWLILPRCRLLQSNIQTGKIAVLDYFTTPNCMIQLNCSLTKKMYMYSLQMTVTKELKQPRRRRQQKPHKFAYLTMKNSIFACFASAFFIF